MYPVRLLPMSPVRTPVEGEETKIAIKISFFAAHDVIIDDRLTVEIGDTEQHLRLQIDHCDHAVIGR